MTLNSTGLGVGGSPTSKLTIFAGADGDVGFFRGGSTRQLQLGTSATAGYLNVDNGSSGFELRVNGVARVYADTSGNVGVGVTPSAWGNQYRAIQIFNNSALYGANSYGYYGLLFNGYNDNTDIKAIASLYVGEYRYELSTGAHKWFGTTANATAGATATPTQAMTLTASGDLLVGTTTTSGEALRRSSETSPSVLVEPLSTPLQITD
jgi:hypothetical protein